MRLAQRTLSFQAVACWSVQHVAITETALLLACDDRPTTCLCYRDWFNPVGGVGSRFNYLVINKDRRLNEQRYAGLQTIAQGA